MVILALYVGALAERRRPRSQASGRFWKRAPRSTLDLAVTGVVAFCYFGFSSPDPNQDWAPEHARMPHVEFIGDTVKVSNVRNFTWRTATDFTPGFYDRVYDLSAINSMYYVVVPLNSLDPVAHVFLCFGFSDGKAVAVSVEGRRVNGRPYRVIPSLFRQNQLIYVIGDEHDVVGLRGAVWKQPVRFYPARATPDRIRAIFVDMMQRAHDLEKHPEFYNLIANNCMTNITLHLRRLGGRTVPSDLSLILTGLSDRVAYRYGFLDVNMPFAQAREAFRIDGWMQQHPLDEQFSARLREHLAQQAGPPPAAPPSASP